MKQLFQNLSDGKIFLEELPVPNISNNQILIETEYSLISKGTELMTLKFGKDNFIQKIYNNQNRVKEVVNKIKTEGVLDTLYKVKSKLNTPIPLGYSNIGKVIKVGSDIKKIKIGDYVVSNSYHSEYVVTKPNLCSKINSKLQIDLREYSFVVLASIALNSIRLSKITLGERVMVIGSGLIGLILINLLNELGFDIICYDINENNKKLVESYGAKFFTIENINQLISKTTNDKNFQVDASFITANTKSSEPIDLSCEILRQKGKIILIGDVNLSLDRNKFYHKELEFMVSSSYGPGRYDYNYENGYIEIPRNYQRWTFTRNFEYIISLIEKKKITFKNLFSREIKFNQIVSVYDELFSNKTNINGIIINYKNNKKKIRKSLKLNFSHNDKNNNTSKKISLIGTGQYSEIILNSIQKQNILVEELVSFNNPIMAKKYARQFKIRKISTDVDSAFKKRDIGVFFICTPHNTHAEYVLKCLEYKKDVFVEKPLAIDLQSLNKVKETFFKNKSRVFVGFNRRYSKHTNFIKKNLSNENISITYTVNAGLLNDKSWHSDTKISGGRIIGEVCHFIDLCIFLCSSNVIAFKVFSSSNDNNENITLILKFENGSICNINYFTHGTKKVPKENIKIFNNGNIFELDNFKSTHIIGNINKKFTTLKIDKGQDDMLASFLNPKNSLNSIDEFNSFYETSKISIEIKNKLND